MMNEETYDNLTFKQKIRLNWRYYLGTALQKASRVIAILVLGLAFGYLIGYDAGHAEGYVKGWYEGIVEYIENWHP